MQSKKSVSKTERPYSSSAPRCSAADSKMLLQAHPVVYFPRLLAADHLDRIRQQCRVMPGQLATTRMGSKNSSLPVLQRRYTRMPWRDAACSGGGSSTVPSGRRAAQCRRRRRRRPPVGSWRFTISSATMKHDSNPMPKRPIKSASATPSGQPRLELEPIVSQEAVDVFLGQPDTVVFDEQRRRRPPVRSPPRPGTRLL